MLKEEKGASAEVEELEILLFISRESGFLAF